MTPVGSGVGVMVGVGVLVGVGVEVEVGVGVFVFVGVGVGVAKRFWIVLSPHDRDVTVRMTIIEITNTGDRRFILYSLRNNFYHEHCWVN